MNKTYATKASDIKREWRLVDAQGVRLGQLATRAANLLIGKDKVNFVPYLDVGDYVVVTNASGISVSGKKLTDKIYYRHSGYPGGLRAEPLGKLLKRRPTKVIQQAVKGMLPKSKLGRRMITRLYVYAGEEHPHGDQLRSGGSKS